MRARTDIPRGGALALLSAAALVLAAAALAAFGVSATLARLSTPAVQAAPAGGDIAADGLVIPAAGRGEAEAAALNRLLDVLEAEGALLRTSSFRSGAANQVLLGFEVEARPANLWRAMHALETGSPALVVTRARATTRDGGERITLSADAVATWAPAEPPRSAAGEGTGL
ncbi:hypothetical protein GC169_04245 [bacterium]|nr:hypothetical protein [bacterium]